MMRTNTPYIGAVGRIGGSPSDDYKSIASSANLEKWKEIPVSESTSKEFPYIMTCHK